jgi:multidrug efflux system outer membrane protein
MMNAAIRTIKSSSDIDKEPHSIEQSGTRGLTKASRLGALGLLGISSLLMTGCLVGPNYQRPKIDAPALYRQQRAAEQASFADLPWWQVFKEETLRSLIQTALANNYDLRVAVTRIEQARAVAAQARSQYFPMIDYQAQISGQQNAFTSLLSPGEFRSLGLGLITAAWELDLWGRIRRSNEAALADLLATEEARRGVTLSLVSDVAQAYIELLGLDRELEVAKSNQISFQRTLDIFTDRLRGGVASKLETDRAGGAEATVSASIPELERQIALKENQINVLLGNNPGAVPHTDKLLDNVIPPQIPVGLPSALLERRPDIMQAEQNVRAANAQIGVATANFFPQIGLTAFYGRVSVPLEDITKGSANAVSIAGTATGPIFQGGLLRARKRQAVAAWQENVLTYQQTTLNAFQEVANLLVSREKYEQIRTEQLRAEQVYLDAVDVATQRYVAGKASYYEVLEAQQQLYPVQVSLAQTETNRRTVVVQLYRSLGGGWNLPGANWTPPPGTIPTPAPAPKPQP